MSFIKEYAQKLVTAEEAVKVVKSHDWVDYGWTTGTPVALDAALAARADELEDVKVRGGILLREPEIFKVDNVADHFTWNSWHMGGLERKAISKGFAFYSPLKYSELPRYYRENIRHVNVAMFQVAPMDPYFPRRLHCRRPESCYWRIRSRCTANRSRQSGSTAYCRGDSRRSMSPAWYWRNA